MPLLQSKRILAELHRTLPQSRRRPLPSDAATALLALKSAATLYDAAGSRKALPLEEVLDSHLESNGRQAYSRVLLTEVRFAVPEFSYFAKFAARASFDFPLFNFSAVKTGKGWRAFAGGWGTRPARLPRTEEALGGETAAEEAKEILLEELKSRRAAVREPGLSPRIRENLPFRKLFLDIYDTLRTGTAPGR